MSAAALAVAIVATLLGVLGVCWLAYLVVRPLPSEDRPEDYAADDDFDPTGGLR